MKKRIVSMMMVMAMAASLFGGCGSTSSGTAASTEAASDEDVPTVKYMMLDIGGTSTALQEVQDKLNELLVPAAQAKIEIEVVPIASYSDTLTMRVAAGESVDLATLADGDISALAQQGMFYDMSELIQTEGQGILSVFEDNGIQYLLDSDYDSEGHLYYLTNLECKAFREYMVMNGDMLEAVGIDPESITSIEDMSDVYAKIHEAYPNVTCYSPYNTGEELVFTKNSGIAPWGGFESYDPLGDSIGALMSYDSTELVNPYDTDEYAEVLGYIREWYEKGYIANDVATSTDGASVTMKSGNTFSSTMLSEQTPETFGVYMSSFFPDINVVCVPLTEPIVNTRRAGAVIPASSKNPEAAMRVLNALYTEPEIMDTLCYGIEGVHWEIDEETGGVMHINSDGTKNPSTSDVWGTSNHFLIGSLIGAHAKASVGGQAYIDNIVPSLTEYYVIPSLGFSFDYTDVSAEYAAVTSVLDQYYVGLGTGSMDPETTLEEFRQKLDDAGFDTVLAEKQKQYDEFLAK